MWLIGVRLTFLATCWADPIDRPAESWIEYDLIAEVDLISIDSQRDVNYSTSGSSMGYGYAATVKVRNYLISPKDTNQWVIIVPTYWIDDARRLPAFPFEERISSPEPDKIACKWNQDKSWLVLKEILSEGQWNHYTAQKTEGKSESVVVRMSEGAQREQEQNREIMEALEQIGEYGKKLDSGILTWEEFRKLTEPLEKIVQQSTSFSIE